MSGNTFQLRRSNWKLKIENQFFFQFQGPIGQNSSKNIPTDISTNMIENYDLFVTATQSNSGATVRELSPICIKWFEIFTKIEIKVFQNPKYFNKTIVSTLTWFITKNSRCLEQISVHSRLLFQFWCFICLRIVVR